jgi:CheY-like chemotaxis protein
MSFNFIRPKWPKLPFEDQKKRSRILVIDDEKFEYIPLFQKDGYAIDKWKDLVIEKLTELESGLYDIILLDIQGVGKTFSPDQGLGALKHIKNVNPTQIVIAYSNSDYNLKYQEFFNLANRVIQKSSDYYIFKEAVDKSIRERFSYEYFYALINKEIKEEKNEKKLEKYIYKSLQKENPMILSKYLIGTNVSKDIISVVLQIFSFALNTFLSIRSGN